ncbi:MAG TPA: NAD-dependent succinate-semialdehyde dehydrogenase [Desulfocapsa sulfexigens]|nr:NAD-dependent succinate-semialdehyde dehydrogenase [Desulfocapsa sulfexigens]
MKLQDPALFRQECYINGEWLGSSESIEVINPADNSIIGSVPSLGAKDTQNAIKLSQDAYFLWRKLTAKERSIYLKKWFDLIIEHKSDLARIMTSEQGKPLAEAEGEVLYGASYVEWFAEEAKRVYGDTIPMSQKGKRIIVLKEPVGVCAAITPWNFPSAMITRKAAPALAAGCTVIVKPAAQTPFSALALAELAHRAGIPKGVFNVITGPARVIGAELTSSDIVRKLSFTGSTSVGKKLMAACSETVKKISLELGGHAPFIVFNDADIDSAVADAVASKYRNSGQTCVCANRFIVQEGVYEIFAEKLTQAVKKQLRVGSGFDADINQGPLIDLNAVIKVEDQIQDAVDKGARILAGGKRSGDSGFFFEPTILMDVTSDMKIAKEETFGPVAPIFVFKEEAEGVAMANSSEYGLASYFFSRDMARCWRVTETLEYGMVGVNTGILSSEAAPFGGMKESGIGREGSKYGIEEYLEIKYMCVGGLDAS